MTVIAKTIKLKKKYVEMFNFKIFTIYLFMNCLWLDFDNLIIDDFAKLEFFEFKFQKKMYDLFAQWLQMRSI
jgi:hypothetical protein